MAIQVTVMSLDFDSDEVPITKKYDKEELTLGRLPSNDIVLARPEVSGRHAKLRLDPKDSDGEPGLYITDLGSSNGTMVENTSLEPYRETPLAPNERVIIGSYLIKPSLLSKGRVHEVEEADLREKTGITSTAAVHEPPREKAVHVATDYGTNKGTLGNIVSSLLEPQAEQKELKSGVSVTLKVDHSNILDLDFEAVQVFTIKGTVIHKGRPLEGVVVDAGPLGSCTTGPDGEFVFSEVPEESKYSITAHKQDFVFEGDNVLGTITEDVVVDLSGTRLFTITGRVTHKGQPLSGVEIDGGPLGMATTGPDGVYSFKDIPEDTEFTLTASKGGFRFSRSGIAQ